MGEVNCKANSKTAFQFVGNVTEEDCPESEYELSHDSQTEEVPPLTLSLIAAPASSWAELDVEDWLSVTETHTMEFFQNNPQLGYKDILTHIDLFDNETIFEDKGNTVSFLYLQTVSWRTQLPNVKGTMVLADAFNSEAGKQAYLKALQASNNTALSLVSDVSVVGLLIQFGSPPTTSEAPTTAPMSVPASGARRSDRASSLVVLGSILVWSIGFGSVYLQ